MALHYLELQYDPLKTNLFFLIGDRLEYKQKAYYIKLNRMQQFKNFLILIYYLNNVNYYRVNIIVYTYISQ